MRQTARLITTANYSNGIATIQGIKYPCKLTKHIESLIGTQDLKDRLMILVPNTLNPNLVKSTTDEYPSYLDFTIIGLPVNQKINDEDMDIVKITGKVFYENLNYNFILIKLEHGDSDQKLKLVGKLNDSLFTDNQGTERGSAKDKYYNIEAIVRGNQLHIVDSWRIKTNNVRNNVINLNNYTRKIAA